ncbi:hypothetical protein KIN20_037372 [Parelaphostrongylus tenuis]|uniref:Uncharacterized protein n=1 Tax=Parelaphostrongylus tenuis TaxID=148309 RepID=A0AAD5REI1_PARTN|nr:hypothetical protein KIN20_037372 [Parelaphostrongylus tenuis]
MGNFWSKADPGEPEHYEEINKLRVADRAKWKYFNKKVEELEVVAQSDISTVRMKSNSDGKRKNVNTNDSAMSNTRMQALSPRVDGLQVAKLVAIPTVNEHTDIKNVSRTQPAVKRGKKEVLD